MEVNIELTRIHDGNILRDIILIVLHLVDVQYGSETLVSVVYIQLNYFRDWLYKCI